MKQKALSLSDREAEILRYISTGLSYKETAKKLDITRETVKKHLKNIYRKLEAGNKIEALIKSRLL